MKVEAKAFTQSIILGGSFANKAVQKAQHSSVHNSKQLEIIFNCTKENTVKSVALD